jgi:hypothetical protein
MQAQAAWETHLDGVHCTLAIRKFNPGVVILKISGTDIGEFGDAPMVKLQECLGDGPPVQLFIDAREVRGASIEVSGEWAAWLSANRSRLGGISMLTGSRFIEVTAEFVRRFADLQGVMRIYTEPAAFDVALADSL